MLYILSGELYRSKNKLNDPIVIYKEFRDENIFEARKNCFSSYSSQIEMLLMANNLEYISQEQAEKDLRHHLYSDIEINRLGMDIVETGIGLTVDFVYDDRIEFISKDKQVVSYKGQMTIHGIENEKEHQWKSLYLKNLKKEYQIYKQNNIDMQDSFIDKKLGIIKTPVIF